MKVKTEKSSQIFHDRIQGIYENPVYISGTFPILETLGKYLFFFVTWYVFF